MTPTFRRLLIGACFIIMTICGIALAFFTFHDQKQMLDWIGAGIIAGGVGGLLIAVIP